MTIDAHSIELFKNLAQWDIGGTYYDFHNDFICIKVNFNNGTLTLGFKNRKESFILHISFLNAIVRSFDFAISPAGEELIIDLLQREIRRTRTTIRY